MLTERELAEIGRADDSGEGGSGIRPTLADVVVAAAVLALTGALFWVGFGSILWLIGLWTAI